MADLEREKEHAEQRLAQLNQTITQERGALKQIVDAARGFRRERDEGASVIVQLKAELALAVSKREDDRVRYESEHHAQSSRIRDLEQANKALQQQLEAFGESQVLTT